MAALEKDLYRNNLKKREFGKEGPQTAHSEQATIAKGQGASENAQFEANPTSPKTASSSCFGIAPESNKTKRAREKLLKQLEAEQLQITPEALKETAEKIYKWIGDNAKGRVAIKGKSIRLFNQNKDAASLSKKVQMLALSLQKA